MTIFSGPAFADTAGASVGTPLSSNVLNALLLVQSSYLVSGGIPVSASATVPPVISQPATVYVINSGTACLGRSLVPTTLNCGTGTLAQDNYVDVDITGAYTVTTVALGTLPTPPAANALRLYRATTGAGNSGVATFAPLANRSPLSGTGLLLPDGSNAAPLVTLAGNLTVGGTTTLNNTTLLGGLVRMTGGPTLTAVLGPGAGTGPSGLVVNGTANGGSLTFTAGTGPTTGTVVTLSCTPGGGQTLLGVVPGGSLNSGGSSRYLSQTAVSNSSGTFSVGITVSNAALAAGVAYTLSYVLVWA
jgi:hypothetical protein